MSVTRAYNSPLRADQQEQVRDRLLLKVGEILADPATSELSVTEVARRAGVSVRTVYRYFPTKEALLDAFNEMARQRYGLRSYPSHLDDLPRLVEELFAGFERNAELVEALRVSKAGAEVRARGKQRQRKAFAKAVSSHTAHLDPDRARMVAAVLHSLISSDTWLTMTRTWGLSASEAADAVKWAIAILRAQVEHEGAGRHQRG
jgi:AcrR family transcriptional regulator